MWEVFDPDSWTQLVGPNCGPELWTQLVHPTREPNLWSLKNKELFRIGLVDRPRVGGVRLVDHPRVEPQKWGGVLNWTQMFCLVF